jgi:hypothetical protein
MLGGERLPGLAGVSRLGQAEESKTETRRNSTTGPASGWVRQRSYHSLAVKVPSGLGLGPACVALIAGEQ